MQTERPPYPWAAATALVVFALYVVTLAPTTAFWDTSEYIAAAKVLGIPHPPGNPLFTLTAHVFGLLPVAASYAARINLFAALTSAAAAGFWFLIAERWLRAIVPHRAARYAAAFAGVFVGATSWTVWSQSTVNEKVYTLSLLSIAAVLWIAVAWADRPADARRDRWLVLIVYLLALSSTNHQMGVLAAPAIVALVALTDWRAVTRPWTLVAGAGAWIAGISVNYIFLPIRAAQYPPINEGEPVGFFSRDLMDVLARVQYAKPPVVDRQADLAAQLANYWQYWTWQFGRDWQTLMPVLAATFTVVGLIGLVVLWRRDRRSALIATVLMATLTGALIFYLNFKYGFSIYPERAGLPREVRERDYFFVASFAAFGVIVALGLGALMRWIADAFQGRGSEGVRWALASPVLALGLVPLLGNRVTASRAGETLARDLAVDLLESVEPYGILITAGDNDTFPLWYAQEVEGVRRDVTLANLSLMNTRWHLRQLRRRETPAFDLSESVALWGADLPDSTARAAARWPKPTEPVLGFSEQQLSDPRFFPEIMRVPPNTGLDVGQVQVRFGTEVATLADLVTVAFIKQNLGKRPIYFSWSTGNYADQTLGLGPYLVSQGMVRKLLPEAVAPSDSILMSPNIGPIDLPRTERLLWDVYHWRSAAKARPRGWVDPPSASILQLYVVVYGGAAPVFEAVGRRDLAARADSVAQAVTENITRGMMLR